MNNSNQWLNRQPVAFRKKTNPELIKRFTELTGKKEMAPIRTKTEAKQLANELISTDYRFLKLIRFNAYMSSLMGFEICKGANIVSEVARFLLFFKEDKIPELITYWDSELKDWVQVKYVE